MKTSLSRFQGTWNVTALEVDGQTMMAVGSLTVKGDRFETSGMGFAFAGKLVVDESKKPATIDMVFTEGPPAGTTNRGIFEFTGRDSWRMCLRMSEDARPKKFSTTGGGALALQTLERGPAKSAKRAAPAETKSAEKGSVPPRDFPTDPIPELAGEWQMVSMSFNGNPLEEQYCKMGKRVASGNELTIAMGPQTILRAFYSIDRAAHTMDYALTHGAGKGKRQLGLYEFSGGVLKTSFAEAGKPRPKDFSSAKGDRKTVTLWKK